MTRTTDNPRRDEDRDGAPTTLDALTALIWSAGGRFDDLVGRWAPPGHEADLVLDLRDLVRDLEGRRMPRPEIAREVLRHLLDAEPDEPLPELLPWPACETRLALQWSNTLIAADAATDAAKRTAPERRWYLPLKFLVEWAVALALTVVLGPALLAWAAVAKVRSGGPALVATTRVGRGGRPFRAFAFPTRPEATGGATALAKLPQLLNVLRGDMALIGPEPDGPETAEQYADGFPGYASRHRVRPGLVSLSGLLFDAAADAAGRPRGAPGMLPRTYVGSRLPYDLEYVRRVGPAIDLRIALGALLATLRRASGACFDLVTPKVGDRPVGARSRITPP